MRQLVLLLLAAPSFSATSLDRPPDRDAATLLVLHFDEPDEAVVLRDGLVVDPVYVGMRPLRRPGRFGGALKFDARPGSRQSLLLPLPQTLGRLRESRRNDPGRFAEFDAPAYLTDNRRGYTIEFWIRPQVLQPQTVAAGLNTGAWVPQPAWQVSLTGRGNVRFECGSALHRFSIETSRPLPLGEWTHVAIVSQPAGVRILLNGAPASAMEKMAAASLQRVVQPGSDGTTLCLGGPGPEAGSGFFDGLLDEFRLSLEPRQFEPDPAVFIGDRKELFLDDFLIGRMQGARRVVNQPRRYSGNPLLKSMGPWDAQSIQTFGTLYDPRLRLFRTWYRAFDRDQESASMCYAYSRDGLHWVQPELGLVEYRGSRRNNIVAPRRSMFVFLDPLARLGEGNICATAKVMYGGGAANAGPFKQVLMRSADGLDWPWGEVEGVSGYQGWPYSRIRAQEAVMAVDRPLIQHVEYFPKIDKLVVLEKEGEADILKVRQWSRIGWDLLRWQDPFLTSLQVTEKNNQAWYGMVARSEDSVLVGLADAYHGTRPGRWIDLQLVSSRDGYEWRHVAGQQTFFPVGAEGAWDAGFVNFPQVVDPPGSDRLWIFYTGSRLRHDIDDPKAAGPVYNVGVAFLRRDGYVSLEADGSAAAGLVETRPIRFAGRRLLVNADASSGSILVEICDAGGAPIPGYTRQEARALHSDQLAHPVEWTARTETTELAGKAVVLRFHVSPRARLYGYRFGAVDPHSAPR